MKSFFTKNPRNIAFSIVVILLALVPLFTDMGLLTSSSIVRFGRYITFAIVAIGIDLIWGYTGILSLGHGIYFCLGAYGMAMYLLLQKTGGKITDFMQRGGFTELPWFWKPFNSLPLSIILMIAVATLIAWVIGYFIFNDSYISIVLFTASYSIAYFINAIFTYNFAKGKIK